MLGRRHRPIHYRPRHSRLGWSLALVVALGGAGVAAYWSYDSLGWLPSLNSGAGPAREPPRANLFTGPSQAEAATTLEQALKALIDQGGGVLVIPRDAPEGWYPRNSLQAAYNTPGVTVVRPLNVFGYDHAPHGHCEILFENVRVPVANILLGEGRGFEIAQGRLGPGRIHHCMRSIGVAERALELMCKRLASRVAFGKPVAAQSVWHERIAEARCMIDQARFLTLNAAWMMDVAGNKVAKQQIAMIKVVAPSMALQVVDWAIQAHGGGGVSDDFPLAGAWANLRTLRFADGPDEVHRNAIAKMELGKYVSR